MRMRAEWLSVRASALVVLVIGCGDSGGGAAVENTEGLQSTSSAMTAEAPAGTCTDSGSTSNVPCSGLPSGTKVKFSVQTLAKTDSGSTSTVPYAALMVECEEADSGSTSTVPCAITVKKK
jgi:hypothetical protein